MQAGKFCSVLSRFSCVRLFATPWTVACHGLQAMDRLWTTGYGQRTASSVHGILQERILEWVAVPSSRRSSGPRDQIYVSYISCIDRQVLYHYGHLESPVHDLKFGSLPTVVIFTDCLGLIPVSVFIFSKIIGPFFIFFTLFSFVK